MKVICINNKPLKPLNVACLELVEGETYNATQCSEDINSYDIEGNLYEPKTGIRCAYLKIRFIPLSTIDEKIILEERLIISI